jgi:hypothetical protein
MVTGECSATQRTFGLLVFADITLELASCDEVLEVGGESIRTPGADLTRVSVTRGGAAQLLGRLTLEYQAPGRTTKPNDRASLEPLLSSQVGFDDAQCPLDRQTNEVTSAFTSLGCQGVLMLSLRDAAGEIVGLEQGDKLRVGEFGPSCLGEDPASELDRYRVHLCETVAEALSNKSGCLDLSVGLASGSVEYEVPTLPR